MKHLIITIILVAAAVGITVVYFKNLNPPGNRPEQVMRHIPNDASLIAEFDNEDSFYDVFNGNNLLTALAGNAKMEELKVLHQQLLLAPALKQYFEGQHVYVSLHPQTTDDIDYLLTTSIDKQAKITLAALIKTNTSGEFKPFVKNIYQLTLPGIKRPFYITEDDSHVISGSFSQDLIQRAAAFDYKKYHDERLKLSEQQRNNALAVLYVDYSKLPPLFEQLFTSKNPDMFRAFGMLPAQAALTLNYKKDALMFNGITNVDVNQPVSYLNLFTSQQPVINHLKDLMPATTAYSMSFAVSDPAKFTKDLVMWQNKGGKKQEREELFGKIKEETGVNINRDFNKLLSNEFTVITTRFQEKLAIIEVTNGLQLRPLMVNISNMVTDDIGQFNYTKLPFYLLGDAFGIFNKPYFTIINNYLILGNSETEVRSYYESYMNQKFISRTENYNDFDDLLSERSNAAFFINFKNAHQVFRRDLKPAFYHSFENSEPGFKDYYGASYQLIAADHNFYTNFCIKLNTSDSVAVAR